MYYKPFKIGGSSVLIYFISDMHFFHNNIINFAKRPFRNEKDMSDALIKNWNNKVSNNDGVYILGDMFVSRKDKEKIKEVLEKLNGKKYLILGNHDSVWINAYPEFKSYFKEISEKKKIHFKNNEKYISVIMTHHPMLEWDGYYKGHYHIFGHIHNKKDQPQLSYLKKQDMMFNACVEVNNYEPVNFNELVENNKKFYERR